MRQHCDNCGKVCRISELGLCIDCEKEDLGVPDIYASTDIVDEDDVPEFLDWDDEPWGASDNPLAGLG